MATTEAKAEKKKGGAAKLTEIRGTNFGGFKMFRVTPTATDVKLYGPNGSGKSTILNAIRGTIDPGEIRGEAVTYGEEKGGCGFTVELETGAQITFDRGFKAGDGTTGIVVKKIDGEDVTRYSDVKEILKRLLGPLQDLSEILEVRTAKEVRELCDVLLRTAGVDCAALDESIAEKVTERTAASRSVKSLSAQLEGMSAPQPGLPSEPVSIAGKVAELQVWENQRSAHTAAVRATSHAEQMAKDASERVVMLRRQLAEAEVVEAEAKAEAEAAMTSLMARPTPPTEAQIEEARDAIEGMEATNDRVREAGRWRDKAAEVKAAESELAQIEKDIDAARVEKRALLAGAVMPEGVGVTEDYGITWDGVGFLELSEGQKITMACAVGAGCMGALGALFMERCESVDAENEKRAIEFCESRGIRLVMCETSKQGSELIIRGAEGSEFEVAPKSSPTKKAAKKPAKGE